MLNKKIIYILLGVISAFSLATATYPSYILILSAAVILYLNRGLYFIVRANRLIINNETEKGYELLERGYNAGAPFVVACGYIYLTLKYGYTDKAGTIIDEILDGQKYRKFKDGQKESLLTIKSLYLWKSGRLDDGIELLQQLYADGYKTTTFYGNYGCLLQFKGDLELAEKVSLDGYDYGKSDPVTLDNLTAIYIEKEEWDSAEKFYSELIVLNPGFSEAYYHGALIEYHKANYEEAGELIDKASKKELNSLSSIEISDIDSLKNKIEENL